MVSQPRKLKINLTVSQNGIGTIKILTKAKPSNETTGNAKKSGRFRFKANTTEKIVIIENKTTVVIIPLTLKALSY